MCIDGLDTLDNKILEVIKEDARLSYSDIGSKVGLSRVAVKNRMDVLENKGVIKGYHTILDTSKAMEGIRFIISIETYAEQYQEVLDVLATDKYIRQVYGTTGNCRIHCQGYAPNVQTLDVHARNLYNNTKGIRKLEVNILITTYKDTDGGVDYVRNKESEQLEGKQS